MAEEEYSELLMEYARYYVKQAYVVGYPIVKNALKSNPDLTSVLLLLIILYISLLILSHATRMIYSTIMSFVKLTVVAIILLGIFWIAIRGVGGTYDDLATRFAEFDSSTSLLQFQRMAYRGIGRVMGSVF
ncbi:hypothetical protein TRICI_005706 [Trichomonascus ciferrii]|uniref:Uncharacterized protein n=1 Tax=Trichomonascus ciferrii TaxID=44093 RepID=A0A642URX9_9ASCO|nr:hypothetical protein TRICI_005706 [Trichomonascus ciferrii]